MNAHINHDLKQYIRQNVYLPIANGLSYLTKAGGFAVTERSFEQVDPCVTGHHWLRLKHLLMMLIFSNFCGYKTI